MTATEERYRTALAEHERGTSLAVLAKRLGVKQSTLVWWKSELRRRDRDRQPSGTFLPVRVAPAAAPDAGPSPRARRLRCRGPRAPPRRRLPLPVLTLAPGVRVFLSTDTTDMRKSFTGLAALAQHLIAQDPTSGHLFAFCNRRRNLLKVLFWDGSGFVLLAKRLERGTFAWPKPKEGATHVTLTGEELSWILSGLDLAQAQRRDWWRREPRLAGA